jgi:hypothetical protein
MNVVDAGKQNVTMYYLVSARSRGSRRLAHQKAAWAAIIQSAAMIRFGILPTGICVSCFRLTASMDETVFEPALDT